MLLTRLDHVAFRVENIEPVVNYYTEKMGFKVVQKMRLEMGGSEAMSNVLNLPGQPFFIFVDQGLDENNIITKWVKKYGSGLHHMAYLVDDIYPVHESLMKQGVEFTTDEPIDTGGGLKQLFTHPIPVTGIITEIIEREKDDIFFVQENVIQLIKSTEGL
jgi:methylmalonyl-CoA/ethylmalonyl-CoA epimerase